MKWFAWLLLVAQALAVDIPKDFGKNAHAVETFEARGPKIDLDRFLLCMYLYIQKLDVAEKPVPLVLVYHVSDETLRFLGPETRNGVRMERSRSTVDATVRYEVWLREPNDYAYLNVLGGVLADYYQVPREKMLDAAQRVRTEFLLMVDARQLKAKH